MFPKPLGDPAVKNAMASYKKRFGKAFPIDWVNVDYFSPEEAVADIRKYIDSGVPVSRSDLVDTKAIFGREIDLSEYLDS